MHAPHRSRLELTRAAARALDAEAQREYGLPGIALMENAARGMAEVASALLPAQARVVLVCGAGNNGGDGYALGRLLANAGHRVELVALRPPREGSEAATQAAVARRMGLPFVGLEALRQPADLVVDAIVGTGLDRPLAGIEAEAVHAIESARRPIGGGAGAAVLALDLPSGIDNDRGDPLGVAVWATTTAVTVAPRPAMRLLPAAAHFGEVKIIDIGAPAELLRRFGSASGSAVDPRLAEGPTTLP